MPRPNVPYTTFVRPALSLVFLFAAMTPLGAQARRVTSSAASVSTETPIPVFRLSTGSGQRADTRVTSSRGIPPLTSQEKLNIAKAASVVVNEVETPVRLTASATRVPNRASLKLFQAMLITSQEPGDEGLLELPLNTAMQINLWFTQAGQPHLLDCLGAAVEPGISLTLVMQAGPESSPKSQLIIPPGWQHITALLIPDKAGAYMVTLWPHNTLDLKYCEITPLK
jgi:hypothetical protein